MLFGREKVLAEIKQQLGTSSTQANPVLIEGNRRTGKTSILHELQRDVKADEMIPVYVSLQSGEGSKDSRPGLDTAEVFRLIARQIGFALNDFGVEVELPGEDLTNPDKNFRFQFTRKLSSAFKGSKPFDTLRLYVEQALDAVTPRKILLMLDEFDHLHVGTQSGVTNPQVPDNIRSLVHEHKNLALIISGTKELKKIRDDYWSTLFGFAYTIPVSGLSEDAAGDLVKIPAQGQLIYQAGAVDEIVRLSGNQPFLIQTLCSRIFSGAVETGNPSVGKSQVANAAERMGKDNEHFRNLFSREINSDLQRIIFVMIVKNFERDGTRFNRGGIEQELYNQNVPYLEEEIDDEIDHLISLELVKNHDTDRSDSSGFEPLVPFFGIWINQNVDYEQLIQTIRDQVI
jgi:type I restriction enzyme M protein